MVRFTNQILEIKKYPEFHSKQHLFDIYFDNIHFKVDFQYVINPLNSQEN